MRKAGEAERREAIRRGLDFLYRTACDPESFELYGHDHLFCFYSIASNSKEPGFRLRARRMGQERARQWRRQHRKVAPDACADTVAHLVFGSDAADRLGLRDPALKAGIKRAAVRFTARDYFGFDPANEAPPADLPACCSCGAANSRGSRSCRRCKGRLTMTSRYEVWLDGLIRSYIGERYGVPLGARYREVLKWLPAMRPYPDPLIRDDDYYWAIYAITHVVYTLNHYGLYNLSPRWLPSEFRFLKANLKGSIADKDPETVGEFLDSLKSFGLADSHPLIRSGTAYLLSEQNPDGSWGPEDAEDVYERYHPTFTAINGLRDHAWRGERLSFQRLKPLFE